jgi:lipoprotein-anchoring transpeptidase ErfK/SrfK
MRTGIRYVFSLFFFCALFSSVLKAADVKNNRSADLYYRQKQDSTPACSEIGCKLFLHVDKSSQKLSLYVDGALTDSFSVSTGNKRNPTPDINMRPTGPTFIKYRSRKYPEGDYKGLGNMPYVIFIKGGYAIHGTTPGNFLRLGHRASHGCIRLHPHHAKKVFDLVNLYGLQNTWVKVE